MKALQHEFSVAWGDLTMGFFAGIRSFVKRRLTGPLTLCRRRSLGLAIDGSLHYYRNLLAKLGPGPKRSPMRLSTAPAVGPLAPPTDDPSLHGFTDKRPV